MPPSPFSEPKSVATDSYGNIYVASYGVGQPDGSNGRIDIFTSKGRYIDGSEIIDAHGPRNLVVDGKGNLYVFDHAAAVANEIMRYEPDAGYNPAAGEIAYNKSPILVAKAGGAFFVGLGINTGNGHLFANQGARIVEYSSAEEGNEVVGKIGDTILTEGSQGVGLAIDSAHKRIYASDFHKVRVFELEEPHKLLMTVEGSASPSEEEFANRLAVAADEGTGNYFIYDGNGANVVYEFDEEGNYVETIAHNFQYVAGAEITVDNGKNSPNGAKNLFGGRYLYVPSHPTGTGHVFAFGPPEECPPKIESTSFTGVTENEAQPQATIQPCGLETAYTLEYTTQEGFEGEGFEGATLAAEGSIPASGSPFEATAALEGLEPDTAYVFRAAAENAKGEDEEQGEFATYPAAETPPVCPNEAFRIGSSKLLPDCRAYELVTPPDTNARTPLGVGLLGTYFATLGASPEGNAATFEIEGGTIPGYEATGSYAGDPYVVHRGSEGWETEYAGPTPAESPELLPGSNSPDQGYSFWNTASGKGSAAVEEKPTTYVRYPDGHSALIGRGSLGTDPRAEGNLIAEDGGHIIFTSGNIRGPAIHLEENAPPSGTKTIYDRTIGPKGEEETHVVSLLPGDETPAEGENAAYEGASLDGKSVAFRIGKALYFRYNDEETYEIGESITFAGFAAGGKRAFYLEGGNLYAYEVEGEENPIAFSTSSNVTPVNVAADGNVAYFVSSSVLTGEPNPRGELPEAGKENLYRSEEGLLSFVTTVTGEDVKGEETGVGFGLWIPHVVSFGEIAESPSRTTPDGSVLLFESEAPHAGYDSEGHTEVYRYDLTKNELTCLSCNPTLALATGDASLQSTSHEQGAPEPFSAFADVTNLREDGNRAIFQSTEPLVLADTDGLQDVYEWEAQGIGSCNRPGGCVYLISSGHSRSIDYLWAVSDSGNDIFFRSSDLLVGADKDETPSIYDARVGGGFAEPVEEEICTDETCHPPSAPPPSFPPSLTVPLGPPQNAFQCPKGKHKVTRDGKPTCVKNKKKRHKHRKHQKAGANKGGTGK